jgi:hypothetical protein
MKVQIVSQTDTGSSDAIVINTNTNPCNIGFGCIITDGDPTYSVQHTFDDPSVVDLNNSATWFPHPTIAAEDANADGNYAFPITAVKLVVTGTGTVELKLVQAGIA